MTQYKDPNFPAPFIDNAPTLRQFDKDLAATLSDWSLVLKAILDRGISIDDNMDADVVTFTSNAAPDTEDTVAHSLGKIPTRFIVAGIDKGGVVYSSGTAFTKDNIYVKTTVASAVVKLILL